MDNEHYDNLPLTSQINFKDIKFFTPLFSILLTYIISAIIGGAFTANYHDDDQGSFIIIIIGLAILLFSLCIRYFTWRKEATPIQFYPNFISIPRKQNGKKVDEVNYADIKNIDVKGKGKRQIIVVNTIKKTYMFSLKSIIESKNEIENIIKISFLQSENGQNTWDALNKTQSDTKAIMSLKVKATITLVILNVLFYLFSFLLSSTDFITLINLGANSSDLVNTGQIGRLFTANFLHLGFLHLYLNMISLFVLGGILERLLGWKKFIIIYLLSCLVGACFSYLAELAVISVGASSGVFGLVGSLLYINLILGFRLPSGFNFSKGNWALILGINIALPFFIPQIDWAAHVGGFIAGVFITWCFVHKNINSGVKVKVLLSQWRVNSQLVSVLSISILVLFAFSFIERANRYDNSSEQLSLISDSLIKSLEKSPSDANNLSWSIVQNRSSSNEELKLASDLMSKIIVFIESHGNDFTNEEKSEYLDTYASIKYQQGLYDDAISAEYQAMSYHDNTYFNSQFSRFISRRKNNVGPLISQGYDENSFTVDMREIHSGNSSFILRRISQRQSLVTSVVVHAWLNQSRQGYFLCVFNDASEIPLNTHANVFGEIATSLTYSIDVVQTDWLTLGVSDGCNAIDVDGNNEIPSDNFLGNFLDDLF